MVTSAASVPAYGSSPTKTRRTQADMRALRDALYAILAAEHPATARGTFYQASTLKLVEKTEHGYKAVVRLLGLMRREGELPFEWLADNIRWQRKPVTYSSVEQAIERTARFYRRALWDDTPAYVEVWLEKDALAGVAYPVTSEFDVPLMVCRGYASISFLHNAAEAIAAEQRPAYIYYFGDYDPSGLNIPAKIEQDLHGFAPAAEIHFARVAVTPEQIRAWTLPTRPTKQTDSRSKGFVGESVELDAIPTRQLQALVRACIERHIDPYLLDTLRVAEASERDWLAQIAVEVAES